MVLASSTTTRVLSMLLLLPMLFHGALQTPVGPSAPSGTASTLSCSSIAKEIMKKLNASRLDDVDARYRLRNLERCLPVVNTSEKTEIILENNPADFQTKLKYYVSQLRNLQRTPRPTSDSAFCPESKE
ncbi:interleukin-3-like [Peromyscus leucopus]|uniref:interleukin-3-like n=1 Tax=Peromyscus leucopus TaxID=10041 RepID=UPI0010A18D1A|nr:interleukin-3-like [Peromyscus leucopus]